MTACPRSLESHMAFQVVVCEGECTFVPTTGFVPPNASVDLHVDAILGGGRAIVHSRRMTVQELDANLDELFGQLEIARARQAKWYGRAEVLVSATAAATEVDLGEFHVPAPPASLPLERQETLPIKPEELDAFHICAEMLELVTSARGRLVSAQQHVRACFSLEASPLEHALDEGRRDAVAMRDEARLELMKRLQALIEHATSECAERARVLPDEANALGESEERLGAEPLRRLSALREEALPLISRCMREVDRSRVELSELEKVEGAQAGLSSLHALHGDWKRATYALIDANAAVEKGEPGASERLDEARGQVQQAECALRSTRTALSAMAFVHLPEWLATEPVLRLCEVDGVAIPGMPRKLSHLHASAHHGASPSPQVCSSTASSRTTRVSSS